MVIINYTDNGKCSNCGQCCTAILPLSKREKKEIKRYLSKHREIKSQWHEGFNAEYDATCPFRDEANRKCLIYEVRPAICRSFKCDKTIPTLTDARCLYNSTRDIVNMRDEFKV